MEFGLRTIPRFYNPFLMPNGVLPVSSFGQSRRLFACDDCSFLIPFQMWRIRFADSSTSPVSEEIE
jgi:hypothetical protein